MHGGYPDGGMERTPLPPPSVMNAPKGGGEGCRPAPSTSRQGHLEAKDQHRRGGLLPAEPNPTFQARKEQWWKWNPRTARDTEAPNVNLASCLIALILLSGTQNYKVDYHDCRAPTRMEKFVGPTACAVAIATGEKTTRENIWGPLTETATREILGWSCELITSEWRYQCGATSQLKLVAVLHLMSSSPWRNVGT